MVNLYNKQGRSLYFANRKEYYRRLRISKTLLKRFSEKRRALKRIRKQVVYNCDYSMSIRAIEINGNSTIEELERKIEEFLDSNEPLKRINWSTEGLENEEIDKTEDKELENGKVYLEVNLKGEVTLTTL